MKAIQIHETGGPEVLKLAELPIPQPGPGQVLIRVEAVGVNFIEVYFRKGVYQAALPLTPGSEAAGTVEKLGPGVTGFAAGDAVASVSLLGSYAEYALVPAAQLVERNAKAIGDSDQRFAFAHCIKTRMRRWLGNRLRGHQQSFYTIDGVAQMQLIGHGQFRFRHAIGAGNGGQSLVGRNAIVAPCIAFRLWNCGDALLKDLRHASGQMEIEGSIGRRCCAHSGRHW